MGRGATAACGRNTSWRWPKARVRNRARRTGVPINNSRSTERGAVAGGRVPRSPNGGEVGEFDRPARSGRWKRPGSRPRVAVSSTGLYNCRPAMADENS